MSRNPRELAELAETWADEVQSGALLNVQDGGALATVLRSLAANGRTLAELMDRAQRDRDRGTTSPPPAADGIVYAVEQCRCFGRANAWAISDGTRHAPFPSDRHAKTNLGRLRTDPDRANVFMWHPIRRPGSR